MKRLLAGVVGVGLLAMAGCGGTASPSKAPAPSSSTPAPAAKPAPAPSSSSGSGSSSATASAAKPLKHVTLLLDWLTEGYQAPFFLGVENGMYKQAGLDVKILQGKGSISTAEQIGHANYTFGYADAEAAATATSQGVPIKVIGDFLQQSPVAIITLTKSHLVKPSDLIGKAIGSHPGSSSYKLLPAFLAANHLTMSQVKVQTMASSALLGALKTGRVAGITEYDIDTLPQLKADGIKASDLPFAKWGVPGLSLGIIANTSYLSAHPNTTKTFVQTSQKIWAYARTHQKQAIAAEIKYAGKVPPGSPGMLQEAYAGSTTPSTKGKPFGWMSKKDWTETVTTIVKYLGVKSTKPLSDYYTNQYLSSSYINP